MNLLKRPPETIPARTLALTWAIIGFVLVAAAVLQPIVASYLRGFTPDELLAPMERYGHGQPLPPEVKALFAGVFANIEFSIAFSAVKLGLGAAILFCVHRLRAGTPWAPRALAVFPLIGIAAFAGIGLFFAYSAITIASATATPVFVTASMIAMGAFVALLPSLWLHRQFRALCGLTAAPAEAMA